jgi:DNA-binding MarR family transcriptional regulator
MKQLRLSNQPFTGYILWQISNLWQKRLLKTLKSLEITHVQFILLSGINKLCSEKTLITQAKLAEFVNTDIMMTSKVVRNLLNRGMLNRRQHPKDTRAYILELTVKGKSVLIEAENLVSKAEIKFFTPLECKLEKFNTRLEKLLKANKNPER